MKRILFLFLVYWVFDFSWSQSTLIPYREGKKWGFKSYETQQIVISPKYFYVGCFFKDRAVFRKGNKFGYLDSKGNEIIKAKYTSASDFGCSGLAAVQKNRKQKQLLITPLGDVTNIRPIDCGVKNNIHYGSTFTVNGKVGFAYGMPFSDTLLQPIYDEIIQLEYYQQPDKLHFVARKNNYWGIVQQGDTIRLPFEYSAIKIGWETGDFMATIEKDGRFGAYVFKSGLIIPAEYLSATVIYNMVKVEISPGVFGYIDDQGRKYWQ